MILFRSEGCPRADHLTVASTGAVAAFHNRGGDGHGSWLGAGHEATCATDPARVRFADFDDATDRVAFADFTGGGTADYVLADPATVRSSVATAAAAGRTWARWRADRSPR
ncbi:hypothetical protein Amsp01_092380 [Amycolatopsis sp. NBRC 101858]|uniref:hypothetical protein n=1 Tax=Amycolatopsis sp. NBRC 101858 TaxID=3032200 RepID=UPI0024A4B984|nr:hypothetical protein [Amycolatopsis sp. NBRC 101858]GLY43215.1 hypothetical protein Amsp01_092380 [Amycolatopsis sp. NBRC 101858]